MTIALPPWLGLAILFVVSAAAFLKGGSEEEKAAEFIAEQMTKPVVAYIAGFSAPPGKTMGHAGAIISGSAGTASAKKQALEEHGVRVGTNPTEAAQLVAEIVGARA